MTETEAPSKIVRALAERWPVATWGQCVYCGTMFSTTMLATDVEYAARPSRHAADGDGCIWARAKRWCADNPRAGW